MINSSIFDDDTIIVTTSSVKKCLLLFISKNLELINIKILEKQELLNDITFTYSSDVLEYMHTKYNKTLDVCRKILDNLYYIDELDEYLYSIKCDLVKSKKIIELPSILKNYKKIVFYDCNLDTFFHNRIKEINSNIKIIEEHSKTYDKNQSYIYEASDIKNEVIYFFDTCYKLLNNGVDISNIKLVISDEEYYTYLEYYSRLYNISINLNKKTPLYNYNITLKILSRYKNKETLEDIISTIDSSNDIISKIINIINKYDFNKDIYDVLVYEFKTNYISSKILTNSIEVSNIDNVYVDSNDYLFILGFNQNVIPHVIKDDDYFKDSKKTSLGLYTSVELNNLEKDYIKRLIRKSCVTYISYKLQTPFNKYIKSNILDEMSLIEYNYNHDYSVSPSDKFDKHMLYTKLDNLYKYNIIDDNIDILMSNVENDYGSYDNSFKNLNDKTLSRILNGKLNLSYTSINSFYECKFKYYLKYLLKIKENSSNINSLFLGNLFHYVLSKVFNTDKDINTLIDEYITLEEKILSNKDKIYLKKYEQELINLVDVIVKNSSRSHFRDYSYEQEIILSDTNKIKVNLIGKLDKILSFDDGTYKYLIIIDYKTGNLKVDYNNIVYGLNMQLFMYAYMINKSNAFKNYKIAGFYLQNIGHDLIKRKTGVSLEQQVKDEYKLYGYSTENIDIMEKFDNDLSSLKNLKIKSDGTFYSNSLVFSEKLLDKFLSIVDKNVKDAVNDIISSDFKINPKEIDGEDISCKYCKYYDICYRKNKDIITLEKADIEGV